MLVDALVLGLLGFGVAKLLNATAFKLKPASRPQAWGLTILMYFVSVVALTALQIWLRDQAISDSAYVPIDTSGAFVFAGLFFWFLKREEKDKQLPTAGDQ